MKSPPVSAIRNTEIGDLARQRPFPFAVALPVRTGALGVGFGLFGLTQGDNRRNSLVGRWSRFIRSRAWRHVGNIHLETTWHENIKKPMQHKAPRSTYPLDVETEKVRRVFSISSPLPLQVDIADYSLCSTGNLDPFDPNDLRTAAAKAAHRLNLSGKRIQ
jgi:hypothetical protein